MDALRYDYIIECARLLESYAVSLSEAASRENAETCRTYFDAMRAVARDIDKTLKELEQQEAE